MWNSAIEFVEDDAAWAGGIKAQGILLVASSQTYRARRRTKKGRQIGAPLKTFTFSQIKTQLKKLLRDKRNQIREQRWIPQVKRTRIEGRTSEKIPAGTKYLLHFRKDINTFMDYRSNDMQSWSHPWRDWSCDPLVLDVIIRDSLLQLLHDAKQNECVSLKVRLLFW